MTSAKSSVGPRPRVASRRFLVILTALLSCCAQAQLTPKDRGNRLRPPGPGVSTPDEAGDAIRRAYDAVSRTSLLLNASPEGAARVIEFQLQNKIAYQEALSCYQSKDYVAAREQAMASADLSRAVEELEMSLVEFGAGTTVPALSDDVEEHDRTAGDLENLEYRLRALQGRHPPDNVIPSDSARLIQLFMVQSGQFEQQSQALLLQGKAVRAGHTARAGDALTHAAEHIGNRYLFAAGIRPVPIGPPLGAGRHPPPPPVPGPGQRR